MVYVKCNLSTQDVVDSLSSQGVDVLSVSQDSIRLVTHLHITDDDVDRTVKAFAMI